LKHSRRSDIRPAVASLQGSFTREELLTSTGSWVTTYRGIRIVIKRSVTGRPIEIGWFIG
jgi:hypothetical protein